MRGAFAPLFFSFDTNVCYYEIIMGLYEFLDKKRTLWIFVGLLVALVVITYLTAGVYRQVIIQGTVWEWVNAPAGEAGTVYAWERQSEESENWAPPPGVDLRPLSGVYVTYDALYKGRRYEKVLAISHRDGYFSKKTMKWKVTGDITIHLNVNKEGYNSVNATFINKGDPNVLHIILTRAE